MNLEKHRKRVRGRQHRPAYRPGRISLDPGQGPPLIRPLLGPIRTGFLPRAAALAILCLCLTGCGGPKLPSPGQLAAFREAGPVRPAVDVSRLVRARAPIEPYRVVKDDLLEIHMPSVIRAVTPEALGTLDNRVEPHLSRVSDAGTVTLPAVGEVAVEGKTLIEVENVVAGIYYPKYVTSRPSVVARVIEYHTDTVSALGAVSSPGLYALRNNEMSLVSLLMKAGGIAKQGATVIRIRRDNEAQKVNPIVVPVKTLDIPFEDVPLKAGDVVEVERLLPKELMVMGLVKKPGVYPYPEGVRYNLLQALAFGGGLDDFADPQYAKIYRQTEDGKVISAAFKLDSDAFTQASNMPVKPGDVVAVEHTALTRTRYVLSEILRFGLGVTVRYDLNQNNND